MDDLLYVSVDKDERRKEIGICVTRVRKNGEYRVLKMELDEQAEILYRLLTEQGTKGKIVESDKESENDV